MIKLMIINTLEQAHKLSHYKYFQMKPNQIISFISCKGFFYIMYLFPQPTWRSIWVHIHIFITISKTIKDLYDLNFIHSFCKAVKKLKHIKPIYGLVDSLARNLVSWSHLFISTSLIHIANLYD